MALMYPPRLQDDEVKSRGERKVFDALRDQLSTTWEVFHAASWMMRDELQGARDGEIDFVICHPERGIVCLEVKGGRIETRQGQWFTGNPPKRMRDPFLQALDHRYELGRKIQGRPGFEQHDLFIVQAVAFPEVSVGSLDLGADASPEIVIDRRRLDDVEQALDRIIAYHRGRDDKRAKPGEAGAQMLRELLAPRITLEVPLAEQILEEEEALIKLTAEQSRLLNTMGREPRMLVTGCAGSGKTMLAVEQAKRAAARGKDVLFVCFNRRLRDHLAEREQGSGVDFYTFHGFCFRMAKRAGVELPDHGDGEAPQSFWLDDMPTALVDAVAELGPQYDALFVDEAQDLHTHWLTALMATLRDEENDQVWLFMDSNQRVYDVDLEIPKGEYRLHDLPYNCRNTQAIHREVMKKYEGEVRPEAIGPEGREIELHRTPDQAKKVASLVKRLIDRDEVLPQDIVVLSSHNVEKSDVVDSLPADVDFCSIRGFKGLESPVTILCELEDLDDLTVDQQLYVGLSRAKSHCLVVVPE